MEKDLLTALMYFAEECAWNTHADREQIRNQARRLMLDYQLMSPDSEAMCIAKYAARFIEERTNPDGSKK